MWADDMGQVLAAAIQATSGADRVVADAAAEDPGRGPYRGRVCIRRRAAWRAGCLARHCNVTVAAEGFRASLGFRPCNRIRAGTVGRPTA